MAARSFVFLAISVVVLVMSCTFSGSTAYASLANAQASPIARATLTQTDQGVHLVLEAVNLAQGIHGVHIHQNAKCEGPDFKSAGSHFNPGGMQHGSKNPEGPHAGDLPNLIVGEDGTGILDLTVSDVSLESGPSSLLAGNGTSIVIHEGPDDYLTDPSGNSGVRIACGMIQK